MISAKNNLTKMLFKLLVSKDPLITYIHNDLYNNHEGYCYITNKEFCDFLSTMEIKHNGERSASEIKSIETSKSALINYDSDESFMVPRNKR